MTFVYIYIKLRQQGPKNYYDTIKRGASSNTQIYTIRLSHLSGMSKIVSSADPLINRNNNHSLPAVL